jgi:hypothetical protein
VCGLCGEVRVWLPAGSGAVEFVDLIRKNV